MHVLSLLAGGNRVLGPDPGLGRDTEVPLLSLRDLETSPLIALGPAVTVPLADHRNKTETPRRALMEPVRGRPCIRQKS